MIPELMKDTEERMRKAIEATRHEFSQIRTGRASPVILDSVKVEMYGQQMPINQLAAIQVPEPRQLLITPYDRQALAAIEKAILKSDVNLTPNNDGAGIRLNIPPLTQERRKEMIKLMHSKAEQQRVAVRNIRQDAVKKLHTAQKAKENPLSENDSKRAQDQVQKLADQYVKQVDELMKAKEAEMQEI